MKAIGILLAVAAAAVVLLFFVCGFIFNQLVWRKTVSIPCLLYTSPSPRD